jgi:hypothetical protein
MFPTVANSNKFRFNRIKELFKTKKKNEQTLATGRLLNDRRCHGNGLHRCHESTNNRQTNTME